MIVTWLNFNFFDHTPKIISYTVLPLIWCQEHPCQGYDKDRSVQSCGNFYEKINYSMYVFRKPCLKVFNSINGKSHFHLKTNIYEKFEQNRKTCSGHIISVSIPKSYTPKVSATLLHWKQSKQKGRRTRKMTTASLWILVDYVTEFCTFFRRIIKGGGGSPPYKDMLPTIILFITNYRNCTCTTMAQLRYS